MHTFMFLRALFLIMPILAIARIDIVYHVAMLKNWEEVVAEQLNRLAHSGLAKACDQISITVVGSNYLFPKLKKLINESSFSNKITIFYASQNLHNYEFPGIEKVIEIANTYPDTKILYMHDKGVTHYQKPSQNSVTLWRRYMEYFAIDQWEDCIAALDSFDACGVDLSYREPGVAPFFAGNFWWARADYIRTCSLSRMNRFDCENYIGTGLHPVLKSFHQSGENPKLIHLYSVEEFPHYYHPVTKKYRLSGIMNLYAFPYVEEYYRK